MSRGSPRNGFSLVELSIVLVILGLLTGGILAGQSLIHAAELRAVTAEYSRYLTATQTFRDKYLAIPGDMNNATRFWNRSVNQAWCATNSAAAVTTPGTCDGNGNGAIASAPAASQSGEEYQIWRQLALAGLIEGDYTGLAGPSAYDHLLRGENVPASRMGDNIWRIYNMGILPFMFSLDYGNALVGGLRTNGSANMANTDVWNIDTKLDDGKPATGRLITRPYNTCTDAASATDYTASYTVTASSNLCLLIVPRIF